MLDLDYCDSTISDVDEGLLSVIFGNVDSHISTGSSFSVDLLCSQESATTTTSFGAQHTRRLSNEKLGDTRKCKRSAHENETSGPSHTEDLYKESKIPKCTIVNTRFRWVQKRGVL